jgi:hypothetical protein
VCGFFENLQKSHLFFCRSLVNATVKLYEKSVCLDKEFASLNSQKKRFGIEFSKATKENNVDLVEQVHLICLKSQIQ